MKFFLEINQLIEGIERVILTYGMIALALLTVGNAISRRIFNHSWSFGEEVSLFILVIVTFSGISYATRKGRHIRMTALFDQLSAEKQRILMIIITAITSFLLFFLTYHSILFTIRIQSLGRVTPVLQLPYYLIVMWVPLGLFFGAFQYLLALFKNIKETEAWLSFETKTEYVDLTDFKKPEL